MYSIQNELFKVILADDFSLEVLDRKYLHSWKSPHPFQMIYGNMWSFPPDRHFQHRISRTEQELSIEFSNPVYFARFRENPYCRPASGPDLKLIFRIRLAGEKVIFRIEAVEGMDEEPLSFSFPAGLFRFCSSEKIQCPLPFGFGALLNFPRTEKQEFSYAYSPANMPFFGILPEKQSGLAVYQKDYCDQKIRVSINRDEDGVSSFEPHFEFHRLTANYPRELHLYLMPPGSDYNTLAKWYRNIVFQEGRFVTLKEKISRSPEVENLIGTVVWKHDVFLQKKSPHSHAFSYFIMRPEEAVYEGRAGNWSAYEIFDTAKKNGFDRVCIYNMGWNHGGFDSKYPERFPPNPERGTEAEFHAAAEYGRSLSPGYICSVHDNYYECYPDSREYRRDVLVRNADGGIRRGLIWRGGRSSILCSAHAAEYAMRDIPRIRKMVGRGSIYLDVFGSARPVACFSPDHPQGEREDLTNRRKILEYAKSIMGSVASEQQPNDYCADIVDLGAFGPLGSEHVTREILMIPVPLWQLVYHDSILNYMAESSSYGAFGDEYLNYVALYCMLPNSFDARNHEISVKLRETYCAEMLRHEFLTPPQFDQEHRLHAVAHTVFSNGTEVYANFDDKTFVCNGTEIPPNRFRILRRENTTRKNPDEKL